MQVHSTWFHFESCYVSFSLIKGVNFIRFCLIVDRFMPVYVNKDDYQEIAQLDSRAFLLQSDTTNYQTQEFTYWAVIQIWNTKEKPVLKVSGKMELENINSGMMTVRRAALEYNVPRSNCTIDGLSQVLNWNLSII